MSETTQTVSESSFFNPEIERVYIPPINKNIERFINKIQPAIVNKLVSMQFSDGSQCFDHAVFEQLQETSMRIVISSSAYQLKALARREKETETAFSQFIKRTRPISLDSKRNISAYFIREAIIERSAGNKPQVQFVNLETDERLHPKLRRLLTDTMRFGVGIPLFVKGNPIGFLWGVRKNRLTAAEKKEIAWQMQSFCDGFSYIVESELDGEQDANYTGRSIERLNTSSQIFRLFNVKVHGQKLPVNITIAYSYHYEKTYRIEESYNVPTSNGYSISLKAFLPEEENESGITMLMIPGFFCNRELMDPLAKEMSLGYGYKVYTLDVRGRSKFTLPRDGKIRDGWTVDDYIEEDFPAALSWLADKHNKDRFMVVGHSMGGMIPRFYASAYNKIKAKNPHRYLPDPDKLLAGVIAITSPNYIDLQSRIPGFNFITDIGRLVGNSAGANLVYQMASLGGLSPVATLDLQRFFRFLHSLTRGMRMFSFQIGNMPTIKDFLGYEQITPTEWYFFMEDVFCEESIKVIIQFVKGQFTNDAFMSFDNKINYTEEQKNFSYPLMTVVGTLDAMAPPHTVRYGFEEVKTEKKRIVEFNQGHLGIMIHPETVKKIARSADDFMQSL